MKDLKVLIVDDDPFNLIVLEGLLKQFKIYNIIKAYNGQQALDLIQSNPSEIDAIFTDNNMPELSGVELAMKVREMQASFIMEETVPIILVSGDAYFN